MANKRKKKMSSFYRVQEKWAFILMLPWLIGVVFFFLKPLVELMIYSFNNVNVTRNGLELSWVGISNYVYVLRTHASYYQYLIEAFTTTLPNTLIIVVFSLFASVILNGDYRFRGAARVIFFLPIILATDLISVSLTTVSLDGLDSSSGTTQSLAGAMMVIRFLVESMNIPRTFISTITDIITNVFETIKLSGVQILIFLAGLQSISPSMYEVAKMEGATGYETFWKVTLPMVSPLILTCTIYTITDNLQRTDIVDLIQTTAFNQAQYGYSAAMSACFFVCSLVVIGIVSLIIGRMVYYND